MNIRIGVILVLGGFILSACGPKHNKRETDPVGAKGTRENPLPLNELRDLKNWQNHDPFENSQEGMSVEKAYKELNLKTNVEPIIVAVIDSGVDVEHEDLKEKIWVNPGETGLDENGQNKVTNGIDDDGNGYIDDVHGWNFLGSYDSNGNAIHIGPTTLEVTRELVRLKKLKAEKEQKGQELTESEARYLKRVAETVKTEHKAYSDLLVKYTGLRSKMESHYELLKEDLNVEFEKVTLELLQNLQVSDVAKLESKTQWIELFETNKLKDTARVLSRLEAYEARVKYYYNENFDPRAEIIKDDPNDISQVYYGNNDVKGPDASHGTHVAGIIAAQRANDLGIDGVATDVKIMAIRAVPDGDEYDKDVALAVRYAVDNGARVINMSFGKGFSPLKSFVDDAFLYAARKGVLIVHAAGNSSQKNTSYNNFPNKYLAAPYFGVIEGWLEVGANAAIKGLELPAYFSNYGKDSVDIFAPGVDILSSIPDVNQYASYSGTSMASPSAAGVAALILSQKPSLTGKEVATLMMKTARLYKGLEVNEPYFENPKIVPFESLSVTGGIVDAYEALKEVLN